MKPGKIALIVTLSMATSTALAGGFDGPFAQFGVGFADAQSKINFPGWMNLKASDKSFIGEMSAGYSQSFGRFNLAAGAYYTLGNQKAGSHMDGDFKTSVHMKLRNTWGLSIEPGFNLSESTLIYASLGYSGTKAHFIEYDTKGIFPWEKDLKGFSLGAGVKHKFTPNLYGVATIRQTHFKSGTIDFSGIYPQAPFKPSVLSGIIGIGYRF